jgi:hypothetical protein
MKQRFEATYRLLHAGLFLGQFTNPKMEVISSSETLVNIQTTRDYIPEDDNYEDCV